MSNRDAPPLIEVTARGCRHVQRESHLWQLSRKLRGRRSLVFAAVQASLPHGLCDALAIELVFQRLLSSARRFFNPEIAAVRLRDVHVVRPVTPRSHSVTPSRALRCSLTTRMQKAQAVACSQAVHAPLCIIVLLATKERSYGLRHR
jgi:hypothetical protein